MEYESSVTTHSSSTSSFDIPDSSDIMDPPLDEEETGSGSGGSVEYSRTQLTETEEIIETEVSIVYGYNSDSKLKILVKKKNLS
jgi:hypothetical protein